MVKYVSDGNKWSIEGYYHEGHRHALKGFPASPPNLTSANMDQDREEYREGYEAGQRKRLTDILKKGM